MFPFLLPFLGGGLASLLGAAAPAATASIAAPALLGAGGAAAGGLAAAAPAATGISSLLGGLGGYALPLGMMGASVMDRMMAPDPAKVAPEMIPRYKFRSRQKNKKGDLTGGYIYMGDKAGSFKDDVKMYKDGGVVRVNKDGSSSRSAPPEYDMYSDGMAMSPKFRDRHPEMDPWLVRVLGGGDPMYVKHDQPARAPGKTDKIKGYADGGSVEFDPMQAGIASLKGGGGQSAMRQADKQIVQQALMALTGQIPPDQPLALFEQRFGKPALADLASKVVEMEGQNEEGMMISGPGDGVSDEIPAQAGQMPVRLSNGEFVVPARTVSALGNGSTESGAKELKNMIRRIDQERHGSTQPDRLTPAQYMPG